MRSQNSQPLFDEGLDSSAAGDRTLTGLKIEVSVANQCLRLLQDGEEIQSYAISTAKNGVGFGEGSYCTPTGAFRIYRKIGGAAPSGAIFEGREMVGEWAAGDVSAGDLILSRILWLDGLDADNANTRQRYIYIHGTNHEALIGQPVSHGCVRMRNADVIDLFDRVGEGTPVTIG